MRTFSDVAALIAAKGEHLGYSEWLQVTQERINTFADATGDHQWIHVDAERAAEGPFGTTIAHGHLSLSLIPVFGSEVFTIEEPPRMVINYGLSSVRFLQPVTVGSRIRDGIELRDARDTPKGVRVDMRHRVEVEGETRAALVAETISLLVP